jgi:uncharacterized protein (TIGR02679 family)
VNVGAAADPVLRRVLLAARDKREQRGASGDGRIVVEQLDPEEALALDGLLTFSMPRRKPVLAGQTLRIGLSQFEAALRACGIDPRREYERTGERSVRDLPAERAARDELRADFRARLEGHELARSRPLVAAWLVEALRQGRVHAGMRALVEQALDVVSVLPAARPLQRTVLAARVLGGDPHGLDVDTPLHGLTVSMLRAGARLDQAATAREVWAAWNVVVDPISSNVVALNLPLLGAGPVAELARSLDGVHAVFTYGQLSTSAPRWPRGAPCFSCENPSVVIAAEHALGAHCPPLICTGGRPSDAARLLFAAVATAGVPIRHHGDFDEAGVQIFRDLEERYHAVPWRFDIESLRDASARLGDVSIPATPDTLEDAVRALSIGVPEELLIDELLSDLAAAFTSRPQRPIA